MDIFVSFIYTVSFLSTGQSPVHTYVYAIDLVGRFAGKRESFRSVSWPFRVQLLRVSIGGLCLREPPVTDFLEKEKKRQKGKKERARARGTANETKGKERKGRERKGKERKGKERGERRRRHVVLIWPMRNDRRRSDPGEEVLTRFYERDRSCRRWKPSNIPERSFKHTQIFNKIRLSIEIRQTHRVLHAGVE